MKTNREAKLAVIETLARRRPSRLIRIVRGKLVFSVDTLLPDSRLQSMKALLARAAEEIKP